ncbi:MAG: glycosyltransferase [Patescibacteria group bacterium]|nr:glycosyltransferase [Patescibacteria group bacterium]
MISFIIPAKNEERYIADCLRSISQQKIGEPFEIIVVDNKSSDATVKVVERGFPQVKVVEQSEVGTNPARQKGFEASAGDILIFLDADVRLPAGWTERVTTKLRSKPAYVAISGPYLFYDFPGYLKILSWLYYRIVATTWQFVATRLLRLPSFVIGGNMVIKRQALTQVGGFDTSLKFYGDDTDTGRRLLKVGTVLFNPRYEVYTSARRFKKAGVFRTTIVYLQNYFSLIYKKRVLDKSEYEEIR